MGFCIMEITATTTPLTAWAGPAGEGGKILGLLTALMQVTILSIFIGLTAGPLLDPFLEPLRLVPRTTKGFWAKLMLFFWVTMPVTFLMFAFVLGGIYAAVEAESFADGFWLVLSEVTNGAAWPGRCGAEDARRQGG